MDKGIIILPQSSIIGKDFFPDFCNCSCNMTCYK